MKKDLIYLLFILFFFGLALYLYLSPKKEKVIVDIRDNIEKIDSLNRLIQRDSILLDSLRNQKQQVIERVIVETQELKTLNPDSTISVFHENTEKYGELSSTKPILLEDSSVLCTVDNLRDANIIAAKYEGALDENKILEEMVNVDSGIIVKKDSIIEQKSCIIRKNEIAYQENISGLQKALRKEKRKKTTGIIIGSSVIAVLSGLLIFR